MRLDQSEKPKSRYNILKIRAERKVSHSRRILGREENHICTQSLVSDILKGFVKIEIDCLPPPPGDESGRSHILSPEGQETLEVAKSLFKALVRNISDGSVTFEVLLLVHNHQNTFLELLNTTCGVEKNDAERSMAKRIEEIEEFCAIKENVGTFIGMCAMISPGEFCRIISPITPEPFLCCPY